MGFIVIVERGCYSIALVGIESEPPWGRGLWGWVGIYFRAICSDRYLFGRRNGHVLKRRSPFPFPIPFMIPVP